MSSLVDCASVAAARTTSEARTSWRLISAIDFDNSSAAVAATWTLPNASFEVSTAPTVCAVVSFDVADSTVAVDFIADTLSATVFNTPFDALAEPGDSLLDGGAARFLLASNMFFRSADRRSVMSSCVPTQ